MDEPTPNHVRESRARLAPLETAIVAGDHEGFRAALFAGESNVVTLETAHDLRYGFFDRDAQDPRDQYISFVEACFYTGQVGMLRAALEARHPERVGSFLSGSPAAWLKQLSLRFSSGQFQWCSLGALACWYPQLERSDDFLDIALEYDPNDSGLEWVEVNDDQSAALIRASRMRLQLKSSAPAANPAAAPDTAWGRASRPRRVRI